MCLLLIAHHIPIINGKHGWRWTYDRPNLPVDSLDGITLKKNRAAHIKIMSNHHDYKNDSDVKATENVNMILQKVNNISQLEKMNFVLAEG